MNIRFFKVSVIVLLLHVGLACGGLGALNWKEAGAHEIPCLHGRLVLLKNMKALFGQDLTEPIKKKLGISSLFSGMILMEQEQQSRVVQVAQLNETMFRRNFLLQSDVAQACEEMRCAMQKRNSAFGASKNVDFAMPDYEEKFRTFFSTFVMFRQDKRYIGVTASVVGNKVITFFTLVVPENEFKQVVNSFVTLTQSFKYDDDFACYVVVLNSNQEKVALSLLLFVAILIAYLCLYHCRKEQR